MQTLSHEALSQSISLGLKSPGWPLGYAKVLGRTPVLLSIAARLSTIYRGLGSSIGHQTELREITSWFAFAAAMLHEAAIAASTNTDFFIGRSPISG